jgi:hypothetical protein
MAALAILAGIGRLAAFGCEISQRLRAGRCMILFSLKLNREPRAAMTNFIKGLAVAAGVLSGAAAAAAADLNIALI